jgi:hypothetical protein
MQRVMASGLAVLSEQVLAEDRNRPEEDDVWSCLQSGRNSVSFSFL